MGQQFTLVPWVYLDNYIHIKKVSNWCWCDFFEDEIIKKSSRIPSFKEEYKEAFRVVYYLRIRKKTFSQTFSVVVVVLGQESKGPYSRCTMNLWLWLHKVTNSGAAVLLIDLTLRTGSLSLFCLATLFFLFFLFFFSSLFLSLYHKFRARQNLCPIVRHT